MAIRLVTGQQLQTGSPPLHANPYLALHINPYADSGKRERAATGFPPGQWRLVSECSRTW